MSSSAQAEKQVPVDVTVDDEFIHVRFRSGLKTSTPVGPFPRLHHAQPAQRLRWELTGAGLAIHWPDVDEDISVKGLIAQSRQTTERTAA